MFAGVNFLLGVYVFFFIPETKKITLEEIDALFGGKNHVTNGEDLIAREKQAQIEEQDEKPRSTVVEDVEGQR